MVRQNVHFCGLTSLLSHSKQLHSYLYLRRTKHFKTYDENPIFAGQVYELYDLYPSSTNLPIGEQRQA